MHAPKMWTEPSQTKKNTLYSSYKNIKFNVLLNESPAYTREVIFIITLISFSDQG